MKMKSEDFSMGGKEIVSLTEGHLQKLRDAGYSEIEDIPERGDIVDGKWVSVPLNAVMAREKAPYELRIFKKFLDTGYKGTELDFVNATELGEVIYVVAKR